MRKKKMVISLSLQQLKMQMFEAAVLCFWIILQTSNLFQIPFFSPLLDS